MKTLLLAPGSLSWLSLMVHSVEAQDLGLEGGLWSDMESALRSLLQSLAVIPLLRNKRE